MFGFRTVLKHSNGQKAFSGALRQVITEVFHQSDDSGQVFNGGFIVFLSDLANLCFLSRDITGTERTSAIRKGRKLESLCLPVNPFHAAFTADVGLIVLKTSRNVVYFISA